MTSIKRFMASVFLTAIMLPCAFADVNKLSDVDFASLNDTLTNASLDGKTVYVDFWASWCKPCLQSFPWMSEMQEKYAEHGLKIIAVNVDRDASLSDEFLENTPAKFDLVFDSEATLAEQFKVNAMPSSYIFDRSTQLHSSHLGFEEKKKEAYEQELRALLGLD